MKITLSLELYTEMRNGGNRGVITMFTRTFVLTNLTGKQLIEGFEDHYIQVDNWIFRPKKIEVLDNENCICEGFAFSSISKKTASLEFFRDLKQKGWVPNIENTKAIQSDGYKNFEPEKF